MSESYRWRQYWKKFSSVCKMLLLILKLTDRYLYSQGCFLTNCKNGQNEEQHSWKFMNLFSVNFSCTNLILIQNNFNFLTRQNNLKYKCCYLECSFLILFEVVWCWLCDSSFKIKLDNRVNSLIRKWLYKLWRNWSCNCIESHTALLLDFPCYQTNIFRHAW